MLEKIKKYFSDIFKVVEDENIINIKLYADEGTIRNGIQITGNHISKNSKNCKFIIDVEKDIRDVDLKINVYGKELDLKNFIENES